MGAAAAESARVQRTPKAVARAGPGRARQVRLGRACDCESASGHDSWSPLPLGTARLQAAAARRRMGAAAHRTRTGTIRSEAKLAGEEATPRRDGEHVYVRCCAIASTVSRILQYGRRHADLGRTERHVFMSYREIVVKSNPDGKTVKYSLHSKIIDLLYFIFIF
jgi:hypothetical protein